jgi:predicted O-methyltransferase YrrM
MPIYRSFARGKQEIILIRGDSHDLHLPGEVKARLGNEKLDFLFIDGDHTYEGVKKDFEMYSPLVRGGGIVAFHDIVPSSSDANIGVPRFWNELKERYPYREIARSWSQGWAGIGIIFLP